jgi:hypothetical protein
MPARSTAGDGSQPVVELHPPSAPATVRSTHAAARRRMIAALLAVAWCASLMWLALTASNPVTLNRRQILEADAVITARIDDHAAGTCRVIRQWSGPALPEELIVRGLDQTAARREGEWILPLRQVRDGYEVVPSLLPSRARLVYPAGDEAVRQLSALLEQPRGG